MVTEAGVRLTLGDGKGSGIEGTRDGDKGWGQGMATGMVSGDVDMGWVHGMGTWDGDKGWGQGIEGLDRVWGRGCDREGDRDVDRR